MTSTSHQVEAITPEVPFAQAKLRLERALRDAENNLLPSSRRTYRTDVLQFAQWLLDQDPMPYELQCSSRSAYKYVSSKWSSS